MTFRRDSWLLVVLTAGVAASFVLIGVQGAADRFGPVVAAVTAGTWIVATGFRLMWSRRVGYDKPFRPLVISTTDVFLLLSSSVYTILALSQTDVSLANPSAGSPEALPGLVLELKSYFLVVHAAVVLLIAWYGQSPGRSLGTAVTVQVVYVTALFEPLLRGDIGAPLLCGNMVVVAALWLTQGREEGMPEFRLTPLTVPLVALAGAAIITTITADYLHASLLIAAKFIALILLALVIMNIARTRALLWLIAGAFFFPVLAMSLVVVVKLVEIGNGMGAEFVIRNRFLFLNVTGPNPVGLNVVVALLMIVGALFVVRGTWARLGLVALSVPLMVALLAFYSTSSLAGLAGGLVVLLGIAAVRQLLTEPRRLLNRRLASGAIATVTVLAGILLIPNAYVDELQAEVSDPSAGRTRSEFWRWSVADIRENPIVGIGLTNQFETRSEHVPEFSFRDVTTMQERRFLLGSNGNQWRSFVMSHPHNLFLGIGETMGIVGLAPLFWLLASLAVVGLSGLRRPMTDASWVMAVGLGGTAAGLVWSQVALGQNVTIVPLSTWVTIGLAGAGYYLTQRADGATQSSLTARFEAGLRSLGRGRLARWWPVLIGGVLTLVLLGLVARPVVAETYAKEARGVAQFGDSDGAIVLFERALWFDPINGRYLSTLIRLYLESGRVSDALDANERLVELRPQDSNGATRLGLLRWLAGDLDAAVVELERAAKIDPWSAQGSNLYEALGLAYMASDRRADAIEAFKEGLFVAHSAIGDSAWVELENGDVVVDPAFSPGGDLQRREFRLIKRLGASTEHPPPPISGTELPLRQVDVVDAMRADAELELATDVERGGDMLITVARIYRQMGMDDTALDLQMQVRALRPEASSVHYDLGQIYVAKCNIRAAIESYEEAIRVAQMSEGYDLYEPFSQLKLGLVLLAEGNWDLADEHLDAALETYRWSYLPSAYEALIIVEQERGEVASQRSTVVRQLDYLLGAAHVGLTDYISEHVPPGSTVIVNPLLQGFLPGTVEGVRVTGSLRDGLSRCDGDQSEDSDAARERKFIREFYQGVHVGFGLALGIDSYGFDFMIDKDVGAGADALRTFSLAKAQNLHAEEGDPDIATRSSLFETFPAWALDANVQESVGFSFTVPENIRGGDKTLDFRFAFAPSVVVSGDQTVSMELVVFEAGNPQPLLVEPFNLGLRHGAPEGELHVLISSPELAFEGGGSYNLLLRRKAEAQSDTYPADVWISGIRSKFWPSGVGRIEGTPIVVFDIQGSIACNQTEEGCR